MKLFKNQSIIRELEIQFFINDTFKINFIFSRTTFAVSIIFSGAGECLNLFNMDGMSSVKYLNQLVNGYNGFMYIVSSDFRIEFMNRTLMNHVGGDATGEICYRVLHGLKQRCSWCVAEKVLSGATANFECRSPRDNRWYYYVSTPHSNEKGEVTAQQLIAVDIHERKQREKQLELNAGALQLENEIFKIAALNSRRFNDIVGQSEKMQEVYSLMLEVSSSDASVLLYGESGTGKELVANAIHKLGSRKEKAFIPVNCGGIPETLIESEFFGYKKGAFTGAHIDKSGFLEIADKGTLFLDEIGEINLNMQVKLLRAIEGDGFTPLGSNISVKPDIRIISATNRDLSRMVESGKMRADFFYRINVVPIRIPPLRERKEDIPLLIYHFLKKFCAGKPLPYIPPDILDALEKHDWPGNVRELQNIIHRYVALGRLDVFNPFAGEKGNLSPENESVSLWEDGSFNLSDELRNYEKQLISQCLEKNQWRKSRTASILGINRKTLYSKMKRHKIEKV